MPIGPSLPPHLAHLAGDISTSPEPHTEGPVRPPPAPVGDEEDDDDYGPALPPHLAAARKAPAGPAGPSLPAAGPSLPSAGAAAGPSRPPAAYEEDSDDDDVIGPMPVLTNGEEDSAGSAVREFLEREERRRKILEEESRPKEKKREEWMLVPPSSGVLSNVDPLRKRPSTFSKSTREPESVDHSVWTETPAEKAQRIADEVAGIKRKKDKAGERIMSFDEEQEERRKRRREEDIRNTLQAHNRGPSLLDQHASKLSKKKKGEDDEAPAIWDHDRDMGVTGRLLTDNERQKKIKDARGLGDRFGHGKAGAYSM
ncbi:hypothetical protein I204_06870 [Kwoniella mangroviensis CBS 8886]|uniref:uncharacterized protein n=1 Tax=Kwoniella mangroviensis CBS 8507 TaxID=1296122 RepID=UPI00080D2274|nr:uncharacterized protein I203_01159 [Kwoniella mangroviensis CBS 8507]OCF69303.1 hypothetical protein I203_01159 [Kwoniella mangroviensis CBS 8507]OCF72490.1 hypothetical protein I204_06870 [Kwoniella mangroviensis CBS 8886]